MWSGTNRQDDPEIKPPQLADLPFMKRREFMSKTALAGAAFSASASSLIGAPDPIETGSKRKMTINLVCGAIGVKAKTQAEVNALAHKHGFESVEARPGDLAAMSDQQLVELQADMKAKGIVFGASSLPVDFRNSEQKFAEGLSGLPALAKGLQRAGVTRMGTWLAPCSNELTYISNFNQHVVRLRQITAILKDHGLMLGLEYVGTQRSLVSRKYPFLHTMAETKELIEFIGTGNVGYVLDSWHWWQAGDTEKDIRSLRGDQIAAVDLNDAPPGLRKEEHYDNQRELPAATGVIDLRTFLNAIHQTGFDGPVRAEPFNEKLRDMENDAACSATVEALRESLKLVW
jgi:sugar phosphate isomerase/epimerase